MDSRKYICLLLAYLTIVSGFSISSIDQSQGRKLFGGYRIVPKICQPTNPSRIKSNEPAICMFNYECSRRQGEVVGACMDGFLFGACCQLPTSSSSSSSSLSDVYHSVDTSALLINEKLDHVPDIPILTNPDGTPLVDTTMDLRDTTKPSSSHFTSSQISELEQNFPAFLGSQSIIDDLSMPVLLSHSDANNDIQEQKETISAINPITTLLHPNQVLQISDPVDQLPGFFSQGLGPSNHSIAETILLNKNGTAVDDINNPDVLFHPANRSTIPPDYFSTSDMATTKMLPVKYTNPENSIDSTTQPASTAELVRVQTISYETSAQSGNKKKHNDEYDREEIAINHIISILNGTTPNSSSKSPTRMTTIFSSNSPSTTHTWVTLDETSVPSTSSGTSATTFYKPSTKPANFYYYESGFPSTTENNTPSETTRPSFSSYYTTINQNYPSTYSTSSSSHTYSSKPTTLAPAPTVIVLGPFDTSETTTDTTSPKPFITRKPITTSLRPSLLTKKPNMGATITHNISTIISTDDTATASATSNIISTSYVNFKLKEPNTPSSITNQPELITKKPTTIWTTLSTWSSKPSFQLKPGKPELDWPQENLTPVHTLTFKATEKPSTVLNIDLDEGTAAPDELNNFPPDRNPNLTNTSLTAQQEKPTIIVTSNNTGYPVLGQISENEIPTPEFIKDEALNNRVDDFVNKIVDSLQNNFQDLKDVVYTRKNVSTSAPGSTVVTQKPPTRKPTGKPTGTRKPTIKRPNTPLKPVTTGGSTTKPVKVTRIPKPTSPRPPGSSNVTTRKTITSTTTKRPKPTKKIATTVTQTSTASVSSTTVQIVAHDTEESSEIEETTTKEPDFQRECGVRPLVKSGRVVGGKGAQFGEWPWQVLVREATWLGLFTKNKCGGVLISSNYVITAAHCQPGFLASLVAVFGEHDISGKLESRASVTRNVKRVIVHRAYNPATFENDLALLELESPIDFDAHIVPICMPPDNADFTGRMATVTGWGRVKYNGGVPSILQEVQVPVMENSVCQDMFRTAGHSKLILDSFLCAGYANGQKDSCEGDSGGPLMMEGPNGRWQLVGTVSHGIKCAAPYLPGVYMRTTFFKPWLHSVTGV